jgi:hypothetical protein
MYVFNVLGKLGDLLDGYYSIYIKIKNKKRKEKVDHCVIFSLSKWDSKGENFDLECHG